MTKKIIHIILSLSIILISIVYLYLNRTKLITLKNVTPTDILIISILLLLFFYLTGYTFKLLVSLMNIDLSVTETLGLSILTNFVNYLGPTRPGAVFKAMYLKSSRNLPYTRFASVLAANIFLAFFMTGTVGVVLLFFLKKEKIQVPFFLLVTCVGLIISTAFPFIYKTPNVKIQGRITKLLHSALEGFRIIRDQKSKLVFICLTIIAQFFLSSLICVVTFNSLGISITFLIALAIGIFTAIANFFTITPNNFGIQEFVIAYTFTLGGFDLATGYIGAGLIRVIHMMLTFTLAPIFIHYLLKSEDLKMSSVFSWKNKKD